MLCLLDEKISLEGDVEEAGLELGIEGVGGFCFFLAVLNACILAVSLSHFSKPPLEISSE